MGKYPPTRWVRSGWFFVTLGLVTIALVATVVLAWTLTGRQFATSTVVFYFGLAGCILAVATLTSGIWVLTKNRRKSKMSPSQEPNGTEDSEQGEDSERGTVPITPADQAQGYGWMKASDLVNEREQQS